MSMLRFMGWLAVLNIILIGPVIAEEIEFIDHDDMLMDHGGGHLMDMGGGMVMGQNLDKLPGGCDRISDDLEITVHAGHKYAKDFPGRSYAFDTQEFHFKPCTRLTVHFVNEDNVRHQWMMHGLPKYLYQNGMFHLEVTGPGKISGTLILPAEDKTYLVHCDLAQHMEKGMKAQLKVGKGSVDLPSIPGVTPLAFPDSYLAAAPVPSAATVPTIPGEQTKAPLISGMLVIGLALGLMLMPLLANKFKGKNSAEVIAYIFDLVKTTLTSVFKIVNWLLQTLLAQTRKRLPQK